MKLFKIGDFELPALAGLDITQRYEPLGGENIFRAASGRGILQQTWQKTRIVTSGSGWVPAGLQSVDRSTALAVACIQPRTVPANPATRQATLPAGHRVDAGHVPFGLAQFANGQTVQAAATLAGNVATVAEVAGAVRYQVGYYPLLTCWALAPTDGSASGSHSWEIVCEEV